MTNMQSGVTVRAFTNTLAGVPDCFDSLYVDTACNLLQKIIRTANLEGTISINEIAVLIEAEVCDMPEYWRGSPIGD